MNSPQDIDILLIEDNPSDAELTIRALKKHKIADRIVVLTDGEEALDFLFHRGLYADKEIIRHPKLVLLDIKLPMLNGLDVLRELKSDPSTKDIPIIMLTSSEEEMDILQSYQYGASSYIIKPVGLDSFNTAIAELGLYWLRLNKPNPKN